VGSVIKEGEVVLSTSDPKGMFLEFQENKIDGSRRKHVGWYLRKGKKWDEWALKNWKSSNFQNIKKNGGMNQ